MTIESEWLRWRSQCHFDGMFPSHHMFFLVMGEAEDREETMWQILCPITAPLFAGGGYIAGWGFDCSLTHLSVLFVSALYLLSDILNLQVAIFFQENFLTWIVSLTNQGDINFINRWMYVHALINIHDTYSLYICVPKCFLFLRKESLIHQVGNENLVSAAEFFHEEYMFLGYLIILHWTSRSQTWVARKNRY